MALIEEYNQKLKKAACTITYFRRGDDAEQVCLSHQPDTCRALPGAPSSPISGELVFVFVFDLVFVFVFAGTFIPYFMRTCLCLCPAPSSPILGELSAH